MMRTADRFKWDMGDGPLRTELHFGSRVLQCYPDRPTTITQMLSDAAVRNGDGLAFIDGECRMTWLETQLRVEQVARGLAERGVLAGDRVALWLHNCVEFPIALLAVLRLGAVAVPISHRSRAKELHHQLNDSGAVALIFQSELAEHAPTAANAPALRWRVSVTCDSPASDFQNLTNSGARIPDREPDEDDLAMIIYTSGTTGAAKGAMISHFNMVHAAMTYETCMQLTAQDCSLISVPMSHVTGIAALIMTSLRCASRLVIQRVFKAIDFLALAAREGMTHTVMVPAMYNLCSLQPNFALYDLSNWRVGGFGGAPMPPATIRWISDSLPGLRLMNCYGATETVSAIAIMPHTETSKWADRVGIATPGTYLLIMDGGGRECGANVEGEVWIRGPTVASGYWNNKAATEKEFADGYWRSGDIGSMSEEGFLGIHDRIKDMINRAGYKIYTTEVESVLTEHPLVAECAVVAKPCPVLGERVHAFISLKPSSRVTSEDLSAFCELRLSDYKVPESFSFSSEPLPRNANGKVMKQLLRQNLRAWVTRNP
jgi:long-chain acyl-CoA synthetase